MLTIVFRVLISMAASGSVLCLLAAGVSLVLRRRLPAGAGYLLRLLALAFFLLPVGWVLSPRPTVLLPATTQSGAQWAGQIALPLQPYTPVTEPAGVGLDWSGVEPILFLVWMAGVAVSLTAYCNRRASCRQYLSCLPLTDPPEWVGRLVLESADALHLRRVPECRLCPDIGSPMVVGLLRPRILLPGGPDGVWEEELLRPAILHELVHCRRGDLWWRALAELNRCLFWWNPLAWRLVREIGQYSELSCDERVAFRLEDDERKRYGWSILRAAEQGGDPTERMSISLRGSRDVRLLQRRLESIMTSKKMTKRGIALILCVLLAVTAAGTLVGCAVAPEKSPRVLPTADTGSQTESSTPASSPEAPSSAPAEPENESSLPAVDGTDAPDESGEQAEIGLPEDGEAIYSDQLDTEESVYPPQDGIYLDRPYGEIYISQSYGDVYTDDGSVLTFHNGIDLAYAGDGTGQPIHALRDGKVIFAGWGDSYGNLVKLQHDDGMETWYAHCDELSVQEGDAVKQGEQIATVGSTGKTFGANLHLEVRVDGAPQDPLSYFPELAN